MASKQPNLGKTTTCQRYKPFHLNFRQKPNFFAVKWFKITETLKILKFEEAGQVMSKNLFIIKIFYYAFLSKYIRKSKKVIYLGSIRKLRCLFLHNFFPLIRNIHLCRRDWSLDCVPACLEVFIYLEVFLIIPNLIRSLILISLTASH